MHAGRLDHPQRLDGTGQLTLDGTLVIDLFSKLADAEFLVVHQLETDTAGLGQAFRSQLEAGGIHLLGRHPDHAAVGKLVGHVELGQRFGHLPAFAIGQIAEQHLVGRFARIQVSSNQNGRHGSHAAKQQQFLVAGQGTVTLQRLAYALLEGRRGRFVQFGHKSDAGWTGTHRCRARIQVKPAYS